MRAIKISVTRAHIRDGVPHSECNCPIALALKDALITDSVAVSRSGIRVNNTSFEVDKKDLKFMERFDGGQRVHPYSFELIRHTRR